MTLDPELVLQAYRQGIFPMGDPESGNVDWYRPDPRAILPLKTFHCPRRLERTVKSQKFLVTRDKDFSGVIDACADRPPTWITPDVRKAYLALHEKGAAHSVETWEGETLAGGVYGVHIGGAFMAESMFHRVTDAGKVALVGLVDHLRRQGFELLDIQMMTPHLEKFGAEFLAHEVYLERLDRALEKAVRF